jgi:hypothetical protein
MLQGCFAFSCFENSTEFILLNLAFENDITFRSICTRYIYLIKEKLGGGGVLMKLIKDVGLDYFFSYI